MKKRSLAVISLLGIAFAFAWTVLVSQAALAQCAVGAINTSCGGSGGGEKEKRATPTTNPALLNPIVNSPALVKPTPTGLAGNPACVPDQTQLQSLCAGLVPASGNGGANPGDLVGKDPGPQGFAANGERAPGPNGVPSWLEIGGAVLAGILIGLLLPAVRNALGGAGASPTAVEGQGFSKVFDQGQGFDKPLDQAFSKIEDMEPAAGSQFAPTADAFKKIAPGPSGISTGQSGPGPQSSLGSTGQSGPGPQSSGGPTGQSGPGESSSN